MQTYARVRNTQWRVNELSKEFTWTLGQLIQQQEDKVIYAQHRLKTTH
jgi:hypothetical protein